MMDGRQDGGARSVEGCCQLAFHGRAEPTAKRRAGIVAGSPLGFQVLLLGEGLAKSSALRVMPGTWRDMHYIKKKKKCLSFRLIVLLAWTPAQLAAKSPLLLYKSRRGESTKKVNKKSTQNPSSPPPKPKTQTQEAVLTCLGNSGTCPLSVGFIRL